MYFKTCGVESMQQSSATHPYPSLFFGGCGRLLHALNPTLQYFLVSTIFGTKLMHQKVSFIQSVYGTWKLYFQVCSSESSVIELFCVTLYIIIMEGVSKFVIMYMYIYI